MTYTQDELNNLERLLMSSTTDNIEIALSILGQERDLIAYFKRHLAVIRCFNMNNKLMVVPQKLLTKIYTKDDIERLYMPIRLFGKFLKHERSYFQHLLPHIDDYVKIGQEYDTIICQNKNYIEHFHKVAYACHYKYEAFDWAKFFYKKAVNLNPQKGKYHFYYALLLLNKFLDNDMEAYLKTIIQHSEKAIELDYSLDYTYSNMATAYHTCKYSDEAITYYLKSIEVNPKRATPFNNLGYLYFELKRYDEAKQMLEKALALEPSSHHVLSSIGELYMKGYQDYEKAKVYLEGAIVQKPSYVFHRNLMGDLYLDYLNEKDKAKYQYEKVLQFDPKNKHATKRLGKIK